MRPATLADARELHLIPSVTNILKVLSKPALEAWKQEQAILAGITLPRPRESIEEWLSEAPNADSSSLMTWAYNNPPRFTESDDEFAKRVVKDMEEQVGEAMDFGTRIHEQIADELISPDSSCPPDLEPYMFHFRAWAEAEIEQVIGCEQTVVSLDYGYAGKLDLDCRLKGIGRTIVDFKSQRVRNGRPTFYDEWFLQLAAYGFALFETSKEPVGLMSVVIDSGTPGPVTTKQWEEPHRGFELFKAAFELWKYQKDYDPCERNEDTQAQAK